MAKKATVKKQSLKKAPKIITPKIESLKTVKLAPWIKTVMGLAGIIGLLAGYVAVQPDSFIIERQSKIAAPVSKVFAQANDFHNWTAWSPWGKMDPATQTTFGGRELGQGAIYTWTGDDKAGQGSMIITESEKDVHITVLLTFLKPFETSNAVIIYFTPQGKETLVRWTLTGKNDFVAKLTEVLSPDKMEKMFGNDLQKGLEGLKAAVE